MSRQRRALFGTRFKITVGGAIVALAVLAAILAPVIAPWDPYQQDLMARLKPGFWSAQGARPATCSAPTITAATCSRG